MRGIQICSYLDTLDTVDRSEANLVSFVLFTLKKMLQRNVEWLHFFNVDSVKIRADLDSSHCADIV